MPGEYRLLGSIDPVAVGLEHKIEMKVFLGRNLDPAGLGTTIAGSGNPGTPFGDVAQLVERLHGMQEVESSNLFVST